MKLCNTVILLGLFVVGTAHAQNFTQENTDKAKAIIDAAVAAHGGQRLTQELRTLVVESRTVNHMVDQSRGTDAPWDTSSSEGLDAIDIENSVYVNWAKGSGGGFENHRGTIINAEESYQLDFRAGSVARIAEPDFATASGPFVRISPALLVRTLKDREANAHYLGETTADGTDFNVVGFSMTVGPAISLYFEKSTNLLRRSERIFPGFGLVEYRFDDYETKNDVPYNREFALYVNGDISLERETTSLKVNVSLDEYITVPQDLASIPEIPADPLSRRELADGVWHIGGNGTYGIFVDMGDYIFAAGGTGGIVDRIESLREVVGDKPVRYGLMTHHHSDHVMAVGTYEEEGATVIAATAHERIVRRNAQNGEALDVTLVDDRMVLQSGDRRVEIIDIGPTEHTEHLLVAWLPDEGILFEADHFAMPRVGPAPPAVSSTRSFATALERLSLNVKMIVSAHSPKPGSMEDLEQALDSREYQR